MAKASNAINAAIQGTPIAPEAPSPWAGIASDVSTAGLSIARDLGAFDREEKPDTNTGRKIDTDRARWG